jgi:hypothetical protein
MGTEPEQPGVLQKFQKLEELQELGRQAKRRYERPRILHREPLEAMAAVCAPHPPAKGNVAFCSQGPISS